MPEDAFTISLPCEPTVSRTAQVSLNPPSYFSMACAVPYTEKAAPLEHASMS